MLTPDAPGPSQHAAVTSLDMPTTVAIVVLAALAMVLASIVIIVGIVIRRADAAQLPAVIRALAKLVEAVGGSVSTLIAAV
jgi:hypothetical protein